ncbi:MAG TPA: DCC1-like thiol-disulfide oxidoreductase family protein [Bdellovibrionota bacterium]|nr:DCC1-like thiol-disulfide oxidoreductase family protein [Bdellovibrionota bacterium]
MLFKEIDARQYAALRIAFGALALFTFLGVAPEAAFYYSDNGWFPLKLAIEITNRNEWTILHSITSPTGVGIFFAVAIAASLAMTFGFLSRLASWVTFLCIVSIHSRNWLNTYGGDAVLRLMVFYVALSPSGLAWSIDALVGRFREGAAALDRGDRNLERFQRPPGLRMAPVWPLRLIQAQLCLIYFTTGMAKLHGVDWLNGNALGLVLLNPIFTRWDFSWIQGNHAFATAIMLMTWVTLAWEVGFPILILSRWGRWIAIAIGVGVHGGIITMLQIHWFGYIMIASYICLLPNDLFRRVEVLARREIRRRLVPRRVRVIYDGDCAFCRRSTMLMARLDWFQKLELIPSDQESRWRRHAPSLKPQQLETAMHAVEAVGAKPLAGMDAFCEIGRVVPALLPLRLAARIPGVRKLGRRWYGQVARERHCLLPARR